jgi:hypothetical protein
MIISHHGHYEFGSPKLPMFPEALMLHYMDDLDSKMEAMRAQMEREVDLDSAWTSYNPSLGRPLLNTRKFLEKGLAASHEVEARKAADIPAPTSVPGAHTVEVEVVAESANGEPVQEERPSTETAQAAEDSPGEQPRSASMLEALQRKFASHKVTPTAKVN